jgi:hypothetical protein
MDNPHSEDLMKQAILGLEAMKQLHAMGWTIMIRDNMQIHEVPAPNIFYISKDTRIDARGKPGAKLTGVPAPGSGHDRS